MGRVEPIDSNDPGGNICLDLPVAAMSDDQAVEDFPRRPAAHDAVDLKSLVRLGAHAYVDPLLRGVGDAPALLGSHCRLPLVRE